ncbi:MAG: TIGR04283 family arsenosugar biosynthesis glycosyltransferase [Candidatus Hydrogenedentota bacterium]
MRYGESIAIIIPALDEAGAIGNVLDAIPDWVDDVIVADNGSRDGTPEIAESRGARVVREAKRGYGSACLAGIRALRGPGIVVFLDADFSDHPDQMDRLVDPIARGEVDFVVGSRARGNAEPGALLPQARHGNALACFLMRLVWGARYTDLGPFRAIRYSVLERLGMRDPDYGWTVEMQLKTAKLGVVSLEVPVDYRKRAGRSKVSGTLRGVIGAGYKILSTIAREAPSRISAPPVERIVVFSRYPEPGKAKTRLIPQLGAEGAAELQRRMTTHTWAEAVSCLGMHNAEMHFAGGTIEDMRPVFGSGNTYRPQADGDLGARMSHAFARAFDSLADRVVIIGTDCPDADSAVLRGALDALRKHDLVLGPATDGGYYLIGLRRDCRACALPHLFAGVDWGSDRVLAQTLAIADRQRLRTFTMAPLDDVDRPEDLHIWTQHADPDPDKPSISVVIPARNEAEHIAPVLERVLTYPGVEVIVVDGASTDSTAEIAARMGATVIAGPICRAEQMNLGSARARGEFVVFLHADTLLPENFVEAVRNLQGIAGAFSFATDDGSTAMRVISRWANLRSRLFSLPYGDQAIFMRLRDFRAIGGFRPWPIMEDYEIMRRLRRLGRIEIVHPPAVTSSRRWIRLGPWRVMLRNQAIVLLYLLGVSPKRLARIYRSD